MQHSALLNVMMKAARKAVEKLQVSVKGPANFVTAADRKAEQTLRDELMTARPGYSFVGEEGGRVDGPDKSHTWYVDPLDGTTNFLHGIPHFSISIGLEREGVMVAALVYNPVSDEMFVAERGKGAFVNDQRLRVAGRRTMEDAVVACGLPHRGRGGLAEFRTEFAAVQEQVAGLRRFGSAALDLAYIAAGRFDIYWERNLQSWDMAAGILLVREAGGYVTDCDGHDAMFAKGNIVAGNETLLKELLTVLKKSATVS